MTARTLQDTNGTQNARTATAAGAVAEALWHPPNRGRPRPTHAFRAAFMAEMMVARVPPEMLDHLAGHAPSSTRTRHYAQVPVSVQREAVGHIPAVPWTPEALKTVQSGVKRKKRTG